MKHYILHQLKVPLAQKEQVLEQLAKELSIAAKELHNFKILRMSLDSRKKRQMSWVCSVSFSTSSKMSNKAAKSVEEPVVEPAFRASQQARPFSKTIDIIGAGPCGLWTGLSLARKGYKVRIYERGNPVESRFKDIRFYLKKGELNPESNVLYGEGGAGAFSDGKLTCRTRNAFTKQVLEDLVVAGAPASVEYDAKPHIGTDQLQFQVKAVRKWILELGGEVHFNSRLEDVDFQGGKVNRILINGNWIECEALAIATGHSARDVYHLLQDNGVEMENKGFAIGFRIEHPQAMINKRQYGSDSVLPYTGTAEYSLHCKGEALGAYSFCMCPGGVLIPCSTDADQVATNGMSYSKRSGKYSNAGIVVPVDFEGQDAFAGVRLQESLERLAFDIGGKKFGAPAQKASSFMAGVLDKELPDTTFPTGVVPYEHKDFFPKDVDQSLRKSLLEFDRKIPGFIEHGLLISPETRTSSPIRIHRDTITLESNILGLYPLGEGAGYAGGIVSSAADGVRFASTLEDLK